MRHYIREEWDSFATKVLAGTTATQQQRDGMKQAFYAGCASIMGILNERMTDGSLPTDKDIHVIDGLVKELKDYETMLRRIAARSTTTTAAPGPVHAEVMRRLERMARDCAQQLDAVTNNAFEQKALGFALFIFSFQGAELTYISNAERDTMYKMLHEFLAAAPPAMTWDEQHG